MRVAVLHGQVAAGAVSQALALLGYEPSEIALSLDLATAVQELRALKPAFVFNLVETIAGKGTLIACGPLLLETLGLPYTGAQAEAMFLTSGKLGAKKILHAAGVATPAWWSPGDPLPLLGTLSPCIVKAAWEHASLGLGDDAVLTVSEPDILSRRLREFERRTGDTCFVETFIDGREFNLSLLAGNGGPEVLPPAEISFAAYPATKNRIVCYRAKWVSDSFEFNHTPRIFTFPKDDGALLTLLAEIALRCWKIFDLRGYARVDFRVDAAGRPWVLEINANPCLSPDSGFVAAAERAGLDYQDLIARIISDIPRRSGL